MTRKEFYEALCRSMREELSQEWDNDGAMCVANDARAVARVLCTLDVSDEVVDYAIHGGFDVILSHHPLIFGALHAVTEKDPVARRVIKLLQNDIAVYSFHTRLDACEGGVNDALAHMLGLRDVRPMADGIGRVGCLPERLSLDAFAERVKQVLGVPFLNIRSVSDSAYCVAVLGGEGKDAIRDAVSSGADTYLSGRLGYHAMIDGPINLIEGGHYFTEKHTAKLLCDRAKAVLPTAQTEILVPNLLAFY